MKRAIGSAAVLAALVAAPAPAIAQVRDTPVTSAAGAGRIAGTVTAAGTGQPLPGAAVNLVGRTAGSARSTRTDTLGQFAFDQLPAGEYTLSAGRNGFLDVVFGQAQPGALRPGTPIALAEGQRLTDLEVALPKGGVITGVVVDEHNYPAPRTSVRAYRYAYRAGARVLRQAGSAQTDDRGIYRIFDLEPGDYVVVATPRLEQQTRAGMAERFAAEVSVMRQQAETMAARQTPAERAAVAARLEAVEAEMESRLAAAGPARAPVAGYAPVYHPGSPRVAMASTVTLGSSEEKAGIDVALEVVPLATISGTLSGVSPLPRGVRVYLTEDGPIQGLGTKSARTAPDGRFTFAAVPPGQYRLSAQVTVRESAEARAGELVEGPRADLARESYWARQDLAVDGGSMPDVALSLRPAMSASGSVQFAGAAPRPELTRIRINFLPFDLSSSEAEMELGSSSGRVGEDGRFTASGLAPGRYRVSASGAGSSWRLRSVEWGGREALDEPLEVVAGQDVGNIAITFADRMASLSGTVLQSDGTPAAGVTVILFPEDRRYWMPHARRIQAARPTTDGAFRLADLPPGDYRLATVVDPEPDIWFDPDYLGQLLAASIPVRLGEGEARVQDVRIGGSPLPRWP